MRERGEAMDIKISGLEKTFGKTQALKPLQIVMKQGNLLHF